MSQGPQSRKRNDSGDSSSVYKRGDGLGGRKTGNVDYSGRPGQSMQGSGIRNGRRGGIISLIIFIIVILTGGRQALESLLNGGSDTFSPTTVNTNYFGTATTNNHSFTDTNMPSVNTDVSPKARQKYTSLKGNGEDTVTMLVYMCGADLETNHGMATADLNEMAYAVQSDQVNIIVETGGAKRWQNSVISNRTNQRWQVTTKALRSLDKNVGQKSMTDPQTLQDFIRWGTKEFPADRYILIMWDHGGGSVTGYGYDEFYPNDSMSVDEIASALKTAGTKFDIIGFDACLMANLETAIAVEPYADYLLASEETEPGTGWYYTDWLSALAKNSSTPSTALGKQIIDDFISKNTSSTDKKTLSLVDLSELKGTIPSTLKSFAENISSLVNKDQYQQVADARYATKEFAQANRIDQVDLIDFCKNLNNATAKQLADALSSAVKYNRSLNVTNAHGLSIYFPYRNIRSVNNVTRIYDNINFDEAYTNAVRSFSTLASGGQIVTNSTSNSLFDILQGAPSSNGISVDPSEIFNMISGSSSSGFDLGSLLGGSSAVDTSSLDLFSAFIGRNHISSDSLIISKDQNDQNVISLSKEEWSKINTVSLNVWVDDGEGYIDLGLDNIFTFTENGDLSMEYDGKWLALNGQAVSYFISSNEYQDQDHYSIQGYIPAMLNGQEVRILAEWTADQEGIILGAQKIYASGIESKGLLEIKSGDVIEPICDYYDYNGNYQDKYYLGEAIIVGDSGLKISDVTLRDVKALFSYQLTDIYNAKHWTPVMQYSSH